MADARLREKLERQEFSEKVDGKREVLFSLTGSCGVDLRCPSEIRSGLLCFPDYCRD